MTTWARRLVKASFLALLGSAAACHTTSAGRDDAPRIGTSSSPDTKPPGARSAPGDQATSCEPLTGRHTLFVASWPEAKRAELLNALRSGKVAVRARSCGIEFLPTCATQVQVKSEARLNCCAPRGLCGGNDVNACDAGRELYTFGNADALASNFPTELPALLPELRDGHVLRVRAESNRVLRTEGTPRVAGDACAGATHFIRLARLGSFTADIAANEAWDAPSVRKLASAGTPGACGNGAPDDDARCGHPFFVELMPFEAEAEDAGMPPRLQCVGLASSQIVGGLEVLPALKDHPDPALRLLATPTDRFEVCAVRCGSGQRERCEKQCRLGETDSCVSLATSLQNEANAAEQAQRRSLLEQACAKTNSYGCYQLGATLDGLTPFRSEHPEEALAAYEKACKTGIDSWAALACVALAERYKAGNRGQVRSGPKAAEYYERACKVGFKGCEDLGLMLLRGDGVAPNLPRGLELLRGACHVNSQSACLELGRLYVEGKVVTKDRELGISYLKLGCGSIDRRTCPDLARLGVKVPPRYAQ